MRRRLYEEEYDGYFTDDRDEDEKKIRDVYRCFNELNDLLGGCICRIDDYDDFWLRDKLSSLDVYIKPERNCRIESSVITLESDRIRSLIEGALLGRFLDKLYDNIKKNSSKIDKILKYMYDEDITFNCIFDDYYQKEFNLKFD
jgi:hypothetical protein